MTRAQRSAFEREARAAGIRRNYRILERTADGALVTARDRPAYYPILYLNNGKTGDRRVLGYDVTSEPTRAAVVARTIRTGRPAATPPLQLVTVKGRTGGVMAFMSVADARRRPGDPKRPIGVVQGAFAISAMLENIIGNKIGVSGLDLYLFDPAGRFDHRLIFWRPSSRTQTRVPAEHALLQAMHWQATVSLIDQRWGAIVTPASAPASAWPWQNGTWYAVMTLVTGLTMTAMIVAYLLISLRRYAEVLALTNSQSAMIHEASRKNTEIEEAYKVIEQLARTDPLTGLANRRTLDETLAREIARAAREGAPLSLVMGDLDHFKCINDEYGHVTGDDVLARTAGVFLTQIRPYDLAARYGGEEFVVVLPGASTDGALSFAERIRKDVSELAIPHCPRAVTISLGVASWWAGDTVAAFVARADTALYKAKSTGRNRAEAALAALACSEVSSNDG